MQYSQLIARIQADIYNNGAELITGNVLQGDLLAIISALASAGAGYGGIITPDSSAPASLDQATFYIAVQPGTYSSFGVTVTEPSIVSYGGGSTLTFTVSPLGLASAIIADNLTTDDPTKALSAAQGVVLEGEISQLGQEIIGREVIETLVRSDRVSNKVLRTTGVVETGGSLASIVDTFVNIEGNTRYLITGRVGVSANACLVCFYDSEGFFIDGSASYPTSGTATPVLDYEVISPANAREMKISGNVDPVVPYEPSAKKVYIDEDDSLLGRLREDIRQLEDEINGEETTETIARYARNSGKALRITGAVESISSATSIVDTFTNIKGNTRYLITGRVGASANSCLVCFYDENDTFITGSASYPTHGTATPVLDYEVISPANALIMRVAGNKQFDYSPVVKEVVGAVSLPEQVSNIEEEIQGIKSVNPGFDLCGMPHDVINGFYISGSTQKWVSAEGGVEHVFKMTKGQIVKIVAHANVSTNYALISSYSSISDGETPSFISGYGNTFAIPAGQTISVEIPESCFLAVNCATGTYASLQRYPQHIYINGDNPFFGLKSIWQGPSTMYGLGTFPLSTRFSERVAKYFGMSHTNYAQTGSTIAKKPDSYESAFGSLADFNAAVSGGQVDTSKRYLVKDSGSDVYPWTIYYYNGSDWVPVQRTASNCQRSPMVDRLSELDADADVIVFLGSSNDFMYDWTEIGEDTDRINTTIKGAMHIICQYLVTNYPNKFIIWINSTAAYRYQGNYTTPFAKNNLGYSGWEEADAVREVLKQYSIPYIDMAGEGGLTPENSGWWDDYDPSGTRVHPNATGYLRLTKYLVSKMLDLKKLVV